jgi:hypothetical protein
MLVMNNAARCFFVDGGCGVANDGRGACTGKMTKKLNVWIEGI